MWVIFAHRDPKHSTKHVLYYFNNTNESVRAPLKDNFVVIMLPPTGTTLSISLTLHSSTRSLYCNCYANV
jgi:hypothetical protein